MAPTVFFSRQGAEFQKISFGRGFEMINLASVIFFNDSAGGHFIHQTLQADTGRKRTLGHMATGEDLV
jgi:hypothetical protein